MIKIIELRELDNKLLRENIDFRSFRPDIGPKKEIFGMHFKKISKQKNYFF